MMSSSIVKKRILIITADDFGYCPKRDTAIFECFRKGKITRSSVLLNGYTSRHVLDVSSKQSAYNVGVHLNLTEGYPICMQSLKSSLTDESGLFLGKFGFRKSLSEGKIDQQCIENEICAQIGFFTRLTHSHSLPLHIDSHQHVHVLPEVCKALKKALNVYELKDVCIRYPNENFEKVDWLDEETLQFYKSVSQNAKNSQWFFQDYQHPDGFIGMATMGKNMTIPILKNLLCDLFESLEIELINKDTIVVEFMVHPGYQGIRDIGGCSNNGPDEFSLSPEREYELQFLLSPEFRDVLDALHIELAIENLNNPIAF